MNGKDEFGDRMKAYESVTSDKKLDTSLPICIRIDGKKFSKFTKGMKKPFDADMTEIMQSVTETLVKKFHATAGYTQSDEITLVFFENDAKSIVFSGREQKICSVVAATATSAFMLQLFEKVMIPSMHKLPTFDARAFNVPDDGEAVNTIVWRIIDARKNSVSATFRWTLGHNNMQNKNQKEMIAYMLEHNVDWNKDFSDYNKYGTIVRRTTQDSFSPIFSVYTIRHVYEKVSGKQFFDLPFQEKIEFLECNPIPTESETK